jgi:hypothetical protein
MHRRRSRIEVDVELVLAMRESLCNLLPLPNDVIFPQVSLLDLKIDVGTA